MGVEYGCNAPIAAESVWVVNPTEGQTVTIDATHTYPVEVVYAVLQPESVNVVLWSTDGVTFQTFGSFTIVYSDDTVTVYDLTDTITDAECPTPGIGYTLQVQAFDTANVETDATRNFNTTP
jgi:hypothetical protein